MVNGSWLNLACVAGSFLWRARKWVVNLQEIKTEASARKKWKLLFLLHSSHGFATRCGQATALVTRVELFNCFAVVSKAQKFFVFRQWFLFLKNNISKNIQNNIKSNIKKRRLRHRVLPWHSTLTKHVERITLQWLRDCLLGVGGWVVGQAEESKILDTATTFLPQRWRQASLATAHPFQEVQEVWLVWTPQEIPVKRMTVLNSILSPHTYVLRFLLCSPFLFFGGMTFKILHPEAAKRYFSGRGEGWRAKVLPKKTFRNTLLIIICARKTSVFKRRPV